MDALEKILTNFGFPALCLAAAGLAAWKIILWVAPRLDSLIDALKAYLLNSEKLQQNILETQKSTDRKTDAQTEAINKQTVAINFQTDLLKEMALSLGGVCRHALESKEADHGRSSGNHPGPRGSTTGDHGSN